MHAGPLEHELLAWCARVTGAPVVRAEPLPGGNRRRAWAVDVAHPGEAPRPLFLRFASEPNAPDDPYDLRREARLYRALAGTPVPLPRLVGEHPAHAALLLERVAGGSDFRSLAQPDATQVARDFRHALHTLHALDAGSTPRVRSASTCARNSTPGARCTSRRKGPMPFWNSLSAGSPRTCPSQTARR